MLNPYPFPLVDYPGRAPELAVRSGAGGWEPYAQAAPADRLLPFVVTRAQSPVNSRWLNCVRIEHADTGALLFTLQPVGYGADNLNALDIPFRKYADAEAGLDHFVYFGGLIQGLVLPCGVPVRLVIDTMWQSPRFAAAQDLSTHLQLEWWDAGPANNVPYGTGYRQRLYLPGAGVQFTDPTEQRETRLNTVTGEETLEYLAKTRRAVLVAPVVPAYLAEALSAAQATAFLELDGERWQVADTKSTAVGDDGGRWNLEVTVKQQQVLKFRAACPAPALEDAGYDPEADAPRPYRCGDTSDTAPDFLPDGAGTCELSNGQNTGYVIYATRDQNPYSPSYNQAGPSVRSESVSADCPVPVIYSNFPAYRFATKNDCPAGQTTEQVLFTIPAGAFTSTVSQGEAQQAAEAAALAGAQAYANENGVCSGEVGSAQYRAVYEPSGCFACQMVNTNDDSDVRGATSEEIFMYYRTYSDDGFSCLSCS